MVQRLKLRHNLTTLALGLTLAVNANFAKAQCGGNEIIPGQQFTSRGITYTISPLKICADTIGTLAATYSVSAYGLFFVSGHSDPPHIGTVDPAMSGSFLAEPPSVVSFGGLTGRVDLSSGGFPVPADPRTEVFGSMAQINPYFYSISSSLSAGHAFEVAVRYASNGYAEAQVTSFVADSQATVMAFSPLNSPA